MKLVYWSWATASSLRDLLYRTGNRSLLLFRLVYCVSWCSGCKEESGCGEEERPTGGRRRNKRLIAKQERVEKEMSNEVKKMKRNGRM